MATMRRSWRIIVAVCVLGYFSAIPSAAVSPALASHFAEVGCPDQIDFARHTPQVTADGATMEWKAKTLVALDSAAGGFAAQVLWVGTDNQQEIAEKWVEGGITDGWQGGNYFRFYSAHGDYTGSNEIYDESLFTGAPGPVVGNSYRFKGYSVPSPGTPLYRVQVDAGGSSYYVTWAGHGPNTVVYAGGFEARGPQACDARIDATYVFANKFRRKSDGVYALVPNNGTRVIGSVQGRLWWCVEPTTFRYWMHSAISVDVCP